MDDKNVLCIIAGSGGLPQRLYQACQQDERYRNRCVVLALEGITDKDWLQKDKVACHWTHLGRIISALEFLRDSRAVRMVVLAGALQRPSLSSLLRFCDRKTLVFAKSILLRAGGDDDLLRSVVSSLESLGFSVLGIDHFLQQDFARLGVWGAP